MQAFHFLTPVWGEEYTDYFLQASLPSQLADGNLPSFERPKSLYKIFTSSRDAAKIRESPSFRKLSEIMPAELIIIDPVLEELKVNRINKYDVMTFCHGEGIDAAAQEDAALFFLTADLIFSDGSLKNLKRILFSGKRMVCIGGYRVITESFRPLLLGKFYDRKENSIRISSRELVQLSLDHLHEESKTLFWDIPRFNDWPAYLFWKVKEEGILQRGIHLSPILVYPEKKDAQLKPTAGMGIDGLDYMMRAVPNEDEIHVVEDSDEFFFVSLMAQGRAPQFLPPSFMAVASWILKHCCPYHVRFLDYRLRFHSRDLSPNWEQVEEESEKVVSSIKEGMAFLKKYPNFHTEFDEQRKRAREFLMAQPLRESYKGYNLTQSSGKFFAFAPALGGLEPALLSEGDLISWIREGKAFVADTPSELKSKIDDSGFVAEMVLLEEGYKKYNILRYLNQFYGLSQTLGKVDLAVLSPWELESLERQGKCFRAMDLEGVKRRIDAWVQGEKENSFKVGKVDPLLLTKQEELIRAQYFLQSLLAAAPNFLKFTSSYPAELTQTFFGLLSEKIQDLKKEGETRNARRLEILRECLQEIVPPPRESNAL